MKQKYKKTHFFSVRLLLAVLLVAGMASSAWSQVTYNGNGQGGFGEPVGGSSMEISDDGTTITIEFNKGLGEFNDEMVIYIDSKDGGFSSTENFADPDAGDKLRRAITGAGIFDGGTRSVVNFPPGFNANYAIAVNVDFGGLWELVDNASFPYVTAVGDPESNTSPSFTMTFNKSHIGLGAEDDIEFNFVVTYMNAFGGDGVWRSDEGYGDGLPAGNPGTDDVTFTSYLTYTPVISWVNLQWPPSGDIDPEQEFNAYAQVWIPGLTGESATANNLESLNAWIGFNDQDANDVSDFETGWTWVEASLDPYEGWFGNNSQYSANIGSEITEPGTYYYVSRFLFGDDDYVYGGYSGAIDVKSGGNFWDGINYVSGELRVKGFVITGVPEGGIIDLDYVEGEGPSDPASFTLAGEHFDFETVIITAPDNFEIRSGEMIIPEENRLIWSEEIHIFGYDGSETTVEVRLKAGLEPGNYSGEIEIDLAEGSPSPKGQDRSGSSVSVSGSVSPSATAIPVAPWAWLISFGLMITFFVVRFIRVS